jgi:hypothetical protein
MNHALAEGGPEAVDQFVARVLRRAYQTAQAHDSILGICSLTS